MTLEADNSWAWSPRHDEINYEMPQCILGINEVNNMAAMEDGFGYCVNSCTVLAAKSTGCPIYPMFR